MPLARVLVVVVLSTAFLALDRADAPVVSDVRAGAATVLGPVGDVVGAVTSPVRNAWHGVTDYDDVVDENAALREQVTEMEAARIEENDSSRRLEELSALMELPWAGDLEQVTARVASGPRSNFSYSVQIDKGRDHGIREGMAVVSGDGLAGRISRTTSSTATVELLTSSDLRVGVRLASSGELGTARGQGRDEPLVVDSAIDLETEIEDGTGLVTSGVERSPYPEAIPVAEVVRTREGPAGLSLELLAEPLVDVQDLSYVSVLIWAPEQ